MEIPRGFWKNPRTLGNRRNYATERGAFHVGAPSFRKKLRYTVDLRTTIKHAIINTAAHACQHNFSAPLVARRHRNGACEMRVCALTRAASPTHPVKTWSPRSSLVPPTLLGRSTDSVRPRELAEGVEVAPSDLLRRSKRPSPFYTATRSERRLNLPRVCKTSRPDTAAPGTDSVSRSLVKPFPLGRISHEIIVISIGR